MAVMRKHKQIDQGSSALVSSLGLCDPHSGPTSAPTVLSTLRQKGQITTVKGVIGRMHPLEDRKDEPEE